MWRGGILVLWFSLCSCLAQPPVSEQQQGIMVLDGGVFHCGNGNVYCTRGQVCYHGDCISEGEYCLIVAQQICALAGK